MGDTVDGRVAVVSGDLVARRGGACSGLDAVDEEVVARRERHREMPSGDASESMSEALLDERP